MTKNNKINFTKASLMELPLPPEGKRSYYYDTKVSCLGIMVFPSGTKTFFLYKRVNGRPDKIKLGKFPEKTVEQARKDANEAINLIDRGGDPKKPHKEAPKETRFSELFDQFLEQHAKQRKKTWKEDQGIYQRYLSHLAKKPLNSITRVDMETLHLAVRDANGMYAANRMLALLKMVFNKAIHWGWEGVNPCYGIPKFKEKSRDRFLHGEELPRFFAALDQEPSETFRDFFTMCLLTGARRSNVLAMRWDDIHLERSTWTIEETKNGESQTIPLSEQAITILARRSSTKQCEWVFPSAHSRSGHIEEPKKAWHALLKRAGIEDLRIHDLRRTLGSWQAATGANSFIIGKSLGHKTQTATAIYARLNLDPVRESVTKATKAMFAFASDTIPQGA